MYGFAFSIIARRNERVWNRLERFSENADYQYSKIIETSSELFQTSSELNSTSSELIRRITEQILTIVHRVVQTTAGRWKNRLIIFV